jgi:hypothetical protein
MSFTHFDRAIPPNNHLGTYHHQNLRNDLLSISDLDENILNPILGAKWTFCLTISIIMSIVQL